MDKAQHLAAVNTVVAARAELWKQIRGGDGSPTLQAILVAAAWACTWATSC